MYNRLKQPEAYRLIQWVDANREDAATKGADKLATAASAALGFKVTGPNVRTAAGSLQIKRKTRVAKRNVDELAIEQLAIAILSLAEKSGLNPFNRAAIVELAGGELVLNLEQKV